MSERDDRAHGTNHRGQHHDCGTCNGIRYDRAKARREAEEDPNRVVAPEEGWRWDAPKEVDEQTAKWASKVLERCFKGSQAAFVQGITSPGSIGVTNFLVGAALGSEKPEMARRLIGGVQAGAAKATGMPQEHFEQEFKDMMAELEKVLREEGAW